MKLINGVRNAVWHDHHQACARNGFAMGIWTQQRLHDHHLAQDNVRQICPGAPGTVSHRRFECPAFDADRREHLSPAA
eukprot:1297765-Pyramimonas_sp.AAC.1